MRPTYYIAAFALAVGSAACVGSLDTMGDDGVGDDGGDPPPTAGRLQFDETVAPMVAANCASCHQGPIDAVGDTSLNYMGSEGPTGYYAAITAEPSVTGGFNPDLANLILKGEHDNGNARAWTQTEMDTVAEWLITEAEDRGIPLDDGGPVGGTTTPTTSREALAMWSACMSIDDWNTSLVYQWADKGSERGQCMSCHNQGAGGYYANDDSNLMYEMNKYEIYITTFFTAAPVNVADPSQGYTVLVNEQKLRAKANATGHPGYNPDGGNQMQYLRNFYDLTKARFDAGTCPPAGFPTTPPPPA
jgi:mono/diheme cytochrome c family protein